MSYQPPFTITTDILNLVAQISEGIGRLNVSVLRTSPVLRKQNRIKTITGTLAIEGNTFTEEQVTDVLEGRPVMGTVRELAEVKGAISAYESMAEFEPDNLEHLLQAHELLMSDVLCNAGKFRDTSVGIHKGKQVQHVASPAHQVSGLMADLLRWLSSAPEHALITSSIFHYEFEFIHPFIDGNGRMGRLWQTLVLSQWDPVFLSLPLESVIKDNQQDYYDALECADSVAESTPFIEFMLKVILQTLNSVSRHTSHENAPINASISAPINSRELKTPGTILALVEQNPHITRQQMANMLGKDIRTVGRAIAKLQESGCLRRVGANKSGHWELL